jgi:hypothetical protein
LKLRRSYERPLQAAGGKKNFGALHSSSEHAQMNFYFSMANLFTDWKTILHTRASQTRARGSARAQTPEKPRIQRETKIFSALARPLRLGAVRPAAGNTVN